MTKSYLHLFGAFFLLLTLTGCREDELSMPDEEVRGKELPVEFEINIAEEVGTRGILNDSKKQFNSGELIHVRAQFECENTNHEKRTEIVYTMLQCSYSTNSGQIYNVTWSIKSGADKLVWPNDVTSATFTAYYIAGTTGPLSGNEMQPTLLSEYKATEIPLFAEVKDAKYGDAIRLEMTRIFSFLTLTEIEEGISDDMWFTLPEDLRKDPDGFHNAFRLLFDEDTKEMKQDFVRIPDPTYKEADGSGLIYVKSYKCLPLKEGEKDDGSAVGLSFFLEPGIYTKFCILYPRTKDQFTTYLSYNKSLQAMLKDDETNPEGAFLPNGRYVFSVRKSLGVVVQETPQTGWDNTYPVADVDVEKFLRAAEAGRNYKEWDPVAQDSVQFLEQIEGGVRMVRNVSFHHTYYEFFLNEDGTLWRPSLHSIFDGDYHYIYDVACPVFFENYGTITNVGFRNVKTEGSKDLNGETHDAILSREKEVHPNSIEMSYNGIVASRNMPTGLIDNVRIIEADMKVQIRTSDNPIDATVEAHNAGLVVGENQGRILNLGFAGDLKITVENAAGEELIPSVTIGGLAGQNTSIIHGLTYITDDKEPELAMPVIYIMNKCRGDSGAYFVGGAVGNNIGKIEELFVPNVQVDATSSQGIVAYLGGITGIDESSNSGAPSISGCMVTGSVKAGTVASKPNIPSASYTGGVSGGWNLQANLYNCSVSVDVSDESKVDPGTEYAQGGAFGVIQPTPRGSGLPEGSIDILTCFSSILKGNNKIVGNFAGITPNGYDWSHWAEKDIQLKQHTGQNIGLVKEN